MNMSDWQDISTAPKDGTVFLGKMGYTKRKTHWGKTSHIPLFGWCFGKVEDVDIWEPTHWKPK